MPLSERGQAVHQKAVSAGLMTVMTRIMLEKPPGSSGPAFEWFDTGQNHQQSSLHVAVQRASKNSRNILGGVLSSFVWSGFWDTPDEGNYSGLGSGELGVECLAAFIRACQWKRQTSPVLRSQWMPQLPPTRQCGNTGVVFWLCETTAAFWGGKRKEGSACSLFKQKSLLPNSCS